MDELLKILGANALESRANIARAFIGASGEPLRYPGVICSREGQELVVGSSAPLLLMELR